MDHIPISVLIVTRSAAEVLQRCLNALSDFDEIIVIDTPTGDGTEEIVEEYDLEYIPFRWNRQYPKKRQWCLDNLNLKHDWVFFVDADEIVTKALAKEIKEIFFCPRHKDIAGYFIKGQYIWNDKKLRYGLKNSKLALFNYNKMMFPIVNDLNCPGMGEVEGHYQPVLKAPLPQEGMGRGCGIGALKAPLLHYANHSPQEWEERHQRYAAWEICMNKKDAWPEDPVAWRATLKKFLRTFPLKPELAFIHSYLLKRGILDGVAGYDFALSRWKYYHMIRKRAGQANTCVE